MGWQQLNTQTGALQEANEPARAKRRKHRDIAGSLLGRRIGQSVLALVPQDVALEKQIMPLSYDGETLLIATSRPDDIALADHLRFLLGRNVRLLFATDEQVGRAIARNYGQQALRSQPRTTGQDAPVLLASASPMAYDGAESVMLDGAYAAAQDEIAALDDAEVQRFDARFGMSSRSRSRRSQPTPPQHGQDHTPHRGGTGMFFYTIDEGHKVLARSRNGRMKVITGPARVPAWGRSFQLMQHHVAHPGQFLEIRFRDGRQQHIAGPAEVWFDPREHLGITLEDALRLSAKEAVVVYSQRKDTGAIGRRIEHGPAIFVPQPGEWLHEFQWHASHGGHKGAEKVPRALVFQKLWLMPDQMYHDVPDVRTADDAVLTIRLMIFFELIDIERMLDTTHDPIGDFINAATSDVVDFTGRHDFDSFKQNTEKLNELETYRQLQNRAEQCGYRINKVVYRGYGAPDSLQKMHNEAIEARTRLQLERATEQQAQDVENYKLDCQLDRSTKRRGEQKAEVEHELELARKKNEAQLAEQQRRQEASRQQHSADAALELQLQQQRDAEQREHFASLKEMGVDLTKFLTQGRADRVIELRGGNGAHVHLAAEENGR